MRANTQRWVHGTALVSCLVFAVVLCAVPAHTSDAKSSPTIGGRQDSSLLQATKKKPKKRPLKWQPPDVDVRLASLSAAPPCPLPQILERAGARVTAMVANLQNFTASEDIEYQYIDNLAGPTDGGNAAYDYFVGFTQGVGISIQETRTPAKGTLSSDTASQDKGLPEMAFIFLPKIQGDYDMACEGLGEWAGKPAWVVKFHQRQDRPSETFQFHTPTSRYPAQLKGRAWIDEESGEVTHLETALMNAIPMVGVRDWSLSIDYAPVRFRTQDVTVWLPQLVESYSEFTRGRRVVYHDFSNFMLFSVQAKQVIDKPKAN